jgi:hypothetical protein
MIYKHSTGQNQNQTYQIQKSTIVYYNALKAQAVSNNLRNEGIRSNTLQLM